MIVIYNCNKSGLYYQSLLHLQQGSLGLSQKVNYDHKTHCKLKCAFKVVNYGCILFIVQAIDELNLILKSVNFHFFCFLINIAVTYCRCSTHNTTTFNITTILIKIKLGYTLFNIIVTLSVAILPFSSVLSYSVPLCQVSL